MIFKVAALLILLCVSSRSMAAGFPEEGDLSIEKELKALNEPPVKTVQLEGEIVDCVDFYKQPAYDHPLLKDHKIQMLPKSYVARRIKQLETARSAGKACPNGTIPMRRTTEEDLVMAEALNHAGVFASNAKRSHQVFVNLEKFETIIRYHGASGVVSVYNLSVNLNNREMTHACMWMENGPQDVLNYIIVGLAVGVRRDINPRLFIFWSADGGKTGCYNFKCKGFVQVDSEIAPGHLFIPVSTFDGPTHDVKIKIFQDEKTGNWLLSVHDEDIIVGYFPKELFPYLKYGAQKVAWGGASYIGRNGNSPPMGSGYMPDGKYNHAAYFRKLTYFDQNFVLREPSPDTRLFHYVDKSGWYGFQNGSQQGANWGSNFLFGGPGDQNCPNH